MNEDENQSKSDSSAPSGRLHPLGSVPIGQLIKLLKKYQRYPIGIANCLSNDTRYVRDDIVDLDAVRVAIKDGSILDLRNFGYKRAAELAELLGLPWPKKRKKVCPHCGRPMPAQNTKPIHGKQLNR